MLKSKIQINRYKITILLLLKLYKTYVCVACYCVHFLVDIVFVRICAL
jgi:hypothetical protein